jgi:DNA polymerase-3 subunit alpha
MSFVHLHLHSEYSLLSSLARSKQTMKKAQEMGMTAVACTDNGQMYGAFKFYINARDAGIKPIIGIDAYKARTSRHDRPEGDPDQDRCVLLAKNHNGYQNLMRMISAAHLEGVHQKPRIDWELMKLYGEDLICLSGSLNGEIPQMIFKNQLDLAEETMKKYLEIFGKNYYLELQRHEGLNDQEEVNRELLKLSRKHGVPVVATNDVHYLNPDDAYAQEVLLCIQTSRAIFEHNRPMSMIDHPDYYFKSADEMKALFHDLPEAIDNTVKIAEECNLDLPYGKLILPHYDIPEGMTNAEFLRKMVYDRKDRVKGFDDEIVNKRLDYELGVIADKGYSNYFLITADYVNWAKTNGIAVGPGRGSAAGSLVSYLLRIIDLNPLEFNLPFERFLNPDRPSPPDIDTDFADTRRDEVLRYVTDTYGADHVAQIITFGSMEPKMAVRDVARALGLSYAQGDRISKMIQPGKQGAHITIDQALDESPPLMEAYKTESDTKQVIDVTRKVEKLPRHSSVHASAVIISDKPLTEYVPLSRDDKAGRIITQYDMYCLDLNAVSENKAVGLLKFDFLGLRNLTIIEDALGFVKEQKGIEIDIAEVPLDDTPAYALMGEGATIGVFQLESPGMRRLAKDLQPNSLNDVTAMVALYRPGPMDLIPTFIEGKKNPEKITYLDPVLEPILSETYGILVYQEQVMTIANRMAGFSMSDADNLRRAMGKKKLEAMLKEKEKFVKGAAKLGHSKKLAEDVFAYMEKFAAYGFNKPHAACYALIAYWTAYIKANYPVEFMTALLTAELQGAAGPLKEQKLAQAVDECRRMKIRIMPPAINSSTRNFSIEEGAIRFGLNAIKNVGDSAIDTILEARKEGPFKSYRDFLSRIDLRKVNKKTMEFLIKAGAFEDFANKATLLRYYPQMVKEAQDRREQDANGQFDLFFDDGADKELSDTFEAVPEASETELILWEKEALTVLITRNPLDRFREMISSKTNRKIIDVTESDNGKMIVLGGLVTGMKIVKTKKDNSEMAFLNLNDETGNIEITAFPKTFSKLRNIMAPNKILLLKGKVSLRQDTISVMLENAVDLERFAS